MIIYTILRLLMNLLWGVIMLQDWQQRRIASLAFDICVFVICNGVYLALTKTNIR